MVCPRAEIIQIQHPTPIRVGNLCEQFVRNAQLFVKKKPPVCPASLLSMFFSPTSLLGNSLIALIDK